MDHRRRGNKPVRLTVMLLIIAALAFGGYRIYQVRQASQQANEVLKVMYDMIPGLGTDTGVSTGRGRDPLPALSISGIDIVGCIEIPALDLMAPVTAHDYETDGFITMVSGSPVKGKFRLTGRREDVFSKLSDANPGDKVIFTDIDGVRYTYDVVTQFHLKDWDEATNDLMLCYDTTDSQTQFVLGCTAAQ